MDNRVQKLINSFKSSLTHCSTLSNLTNDSNNPYLLTSPRNFISGSKINLPIKINLAHRQQNFSNYYVESHFAKTYSLNKKIVSPKNISHRTLSHYNTQHNQSYSINNIENYTTNCLSTTSRTEITRNSNKANIKLLDNFEKYNKKKNAKKDELIDDYKKKHLMKNISEMTQNFKDENPFQDTKRYNLFLRNMIGDSSQINFIIDINKKNRNISENKVFSETNKIFFTYLMSDLKKFKNKASKNKILSLGKFNNINKGKITNLKDQKIFFIKNKTKNVFPSNKTLFITNKDNFHKHRSFSYNKININLNDLF